MKKEIRKNILAQKDHMSDEVIFSKSMDIFNNISKHDFYNEASSVMIYISFGKEVLTRFIIDDFLSKGKKVFIPVTVPETKALIVSELKDFEKDLQPGNMGIMEPVPNALRPVDPSLIDLLIVPGVAFDTRGYRIGYGGGYYDRFIPRLENDIKTVSLAFDMQIVDHIPYDQYDIPVQYIVTESQFIKCTK